VIRLRPCWKIPINAPFCVLPKKKIRITHFQNQRYISISMSL
jgi:hypothetical protein